MWELKVDIRFKSKNITALKQQVKKKQKFLGYVIKE